MDSLLRCIVNLAFGAMRYSDILKINYFLYNIHFTGIMEQSHFLFKDETLKEYPDMTRTEKYLQTNQSVNLIN